MYGYICHSERVPLSFLPYQRSGIAVPVAEIVLAGVCLQ